MIATREKDQPVQTEIVEDPFAFVGFPLKMLATAGDCARAVDILEE